MNPAQHKTGRARGGPGLRVRGPFLSGLPGAIPPKGLSSPGLVVLDLMRLFCDPASPAYLPSYAAIESRLFDLVDLVAAKGRPVLFTRHAHEEGDDGGLIGRMYRRLQRAGDPLNELVPEARRRIPPGREAVKSRHSPFYEGCAARLFDGCDSLLIAGVQTQACVLATALDCARLGLVPLVVADACASKDARLHRRALEVLASGHAYVLAAGEAAAALFPGTRRR